MTRRSLSKAKRIRIFDRAKGVCHLCKLTILVGDPWEADHVKPLWAGGADEEHNMAPAHLDCHAKKSKGDAAPKAKADRQRANYIGVKPVGVGQLQSAGFRKFERPSKIAAERVEKTSLPPRPMFKD